MFVHGKLLFELVHVFLLSLLLFLIPFILLGNIISILVLLSLGKTESKDFEFGQLNPKTVVNVYQSLAELRLVSATVLLRFNLFFR